VLAGAGSTRTGPSSFAANSARRSTGRPAAHAPQTGVRCRQPTRPVPASASATPYRPQAHQLSQIARTRCLLYRSPRSYLMYRPDAVTSISSADRFSVAQPSDLASASSCRQ